MTSGPSSGWLARLILVRRAHRLPHTTVVSSFPSRRSIHTDSRGPQQQPWQGRAAPSPAASNAISTTLHTAARAFTTLAATHPCRASGSASAAAAPAVPHERVAADDDDDSGGGVAPSARAASPAVKRRGMRKRAGGGARSAAGMRPISRPLAAVAEPSRPAPEVVSPPVAGTTEATTTAARAPSPAAPARRVMTSEQGKRRSEPSPMTAAPTAAERATGEADRDEGEDEGVTIAAAAAASLTRPNGHSAKVHVPLKSSAPAEALRTEPRMDTAASAEEPELRVPLTVTAKNDASAMATSIPSVRSIIGKKKKKQKRGSPNGSNTAAHVLAAVVEKQQQQRTRQGQVSAGTTSVKAARIAETKEPAVHEPPTKTAASAPQEGAPSTPPPPRVVAAATTPSAERITNHVDINTAKHTDACAAAVPTPISSSSTTTTTTAASAKNWVELSGPRSTSRNNKSTKRRAGQTRGGRGGSKQAARSHDKDGAAAAAAESVAEEEVSAASGATDVAEVEEEAAAAAAIVAAVEAVVEEEAAAAAAAAAAPEVHRTLTPNHSRVGDASDAEDADVSQNDTTRARGKGPEEEEEEDATLQEAQAAIEAAVEAALAADVADATDKRKKTKAPRTVSASAEATEAEDFAPAAVAADAVGHVAMATKDDRSVSGSSGKKLKKKGKKKKSKRLHAAAATAVAPDVADVATASGATIDEEAVAAAEQADHNDSSADAAPADAAAGEQENRGEASSSAAVGAEAAEMETIFADSWLPSSSMIAKRARERRAQAKKDAEAHEADAVTAEAEAEDVVTGDEETPDAATATAAAAAAVGASAMHIGVGAGDDGASTKHAVSESALTEVEAECTTDASPASPPRTVKGKRGATPKQKRSTVASVEAKEKEGREEQPETEAAEDAVAASAEVDVPVMPVAAAKSSAPSAAVRAKKKMKLRGGKRLKTLLMRQLQKMAQQQQQQQLQQQPQLTTAAAAATPASAATAPKANRRRVVAESEAAVGDTESAPVAPASRSPKKRQKAKSAKRRIRAAAAVAEPALVDGEVEVEEEAERAGVAASTATAPVATVLVDDEDLHGAETQALEAELRRIAAALLDEEAAGAAGGVTPAAPSSVARDGEGAATNTPAVHAKSKSSASGLRAKILGISAKSSGAGHAESAATAAGGKKGSAGASSSSTPRSGGGPNSGSAGGGSKSSNPLFYPDYREQVLIIFQQLAEINYALGEKYKTASYSSAKEQLKKNDTIFKVLPPHLKPVDDAALAACGTKEEVAAFLGKRRYVRDTAKPIPGVGEKLRKKIVEILETGDLPELHTLKQKPLIRAIQELTQVHGFGPRTAISFYKDYGIASVEGLKAYAKAHDKLGAPVAAGKGSKKKGFHLTDAQRVGLMYYEDIQQRIPHSEGRLHEAYLKLKVRKHLGKHYDVTVCGSYRRKCETSGDIDVLITPKVGGAASAAKTTAKARGSASADEEEDPLALSKNALATFVAALQSEKYMQATLAQGPTKFMGVCRLRSLSSSSGGGSGKKSAATKHFKARRIDIRFVDDASFPAALLYFTGSKNFNVIMRAEAIKKNFILNEYGLFRNNSKDYAATSKLHEMVSKLSKAQFYSSKSALKSAASSSAESTAELREISKKVESLRVKVSNEKDIFDAIGMDYVAPEDRNL